jgi:hypothetical protein
MSKRYEIAPLKWRDDGPGWVANSVVGNFHILPLNGGMFRLSQMGYRFNNPYYSLRAAKRAARRHNRQLILPALVEVPS